MRKKNVTDVSGRSGDVSPGGYLHTAASDPSAREGGKMHLLYRDQKSERVVLVLH